MGRTRMLTVVVSMSVIAAMPVMAAPSDPEPGTVEWQARDAENMAYATQRQQDMMTNPHYGALYWTETVAVTGENIADQLQHPDRPQVTLSRVLPGETADPYRRHWNGARGVAAPVEFINACGARIVGTVWGPKVGAPDPVVPDATLQPPFPAVVITTGSIQGYEEMYWWAAQGLAEAGYVVMTWDVMGQGESDATCRNGSAATGFDRGTLDALDWFLSDANPLRGWLDPSRLGLAGHSAGAFATGAIAQRDERIDAVVGWDSISVPAAVTPRVPTMSQIAEYFFNPTPAFSQPSEGKRAWYSRFEEAGVPAQQIALRGSTHLEWTFVPYILPASRDGERVAMYYTLAWFDRWLKGPTDAAYAADADRRLTATEFDASSDASSIGAGTWDPATNTNVPNTIAGEAVADHLSIYYRSSYALPGGACADMRAGC